MSVAKTLQRGSQPAPADGLQPVHPSESEMPPQEFLQKCSSERRLIPLNRLGVHPTNRKGKPLNGAQVMALMMRFRKGSMGGGEDFQIYRYSPARVVEPDPSDPGATARHTNNMAAIDHRIRPVADPSNKGLFGLFIAIQTFQFPGPFYIEFGNLVKQPFSLQIIVDRQRIIGQICLKK